MYFHLDRKDGGQRVNLMCAGREHIDVTNVEFKYKKEFKSTQTKIDKAWKHFMNKQSETRNAALQSYASAKDRAL